MDSNHKAHISTLKINHFSPDKVPWRRLGQYAYRIIEDGTNTQMRLGVIESQIPPHAVGPVVHFHEMHDEGFYVTKGIVRFHSPGRPDVDAKAGDMVIIPTRMPHKFSNPFDQEAVFVGTTSPGFYVRYFEILEEMVGKGRELTPEVNRAAMLRFGTVPLTQEVVDMLEEERRGGVGQPEREQRLNGTMHDEIENGTKSLEKLEQQPLVKGKSDGVLEVGNAAPGMDVKGGSHAGTGHVRNRAAELS